jgi:hypothetical protein
MARNMQISHNKYAVVAKGKVSVVEPTISIISRGNKTLITVFSASGDSRERILNIC